MIQNESFNRTKLPLVQITILIRDKEKSLPVYLESIKNTDYDKSRIELYIHTNNNTDNSASIIKEWLKENSNDYRYVTYIEEDIEELRDHPARRSETSEADWYASGGIRLKKLAEIRQNSLVYAKQRGCEFYFSYDVDTFAPPDVLSYLVKEDRPIIAPMMIHCNDEPPRNFFFSCSDSGYFEYDEHAIPFFNEKLKGTLEVPLVHICYLVKTKYLEHGLDYVTDGGRMEFVTFAESARKNNIKQYVTNQVKALYEMPKSYDEGVEFCKNHKYNFSYEIKS